MTIDRLVFRVLDWFVLFTFGIWEANAESFEDYYIPGVFLMDVFSLYRL